ncbi:S66 family peptidase [Candidatus Merdisoma sp. HCP28S3_D10]|uniref:S66 family peptidase n=1 Tax=unclassified Candidatus Merdisoma TaxID=3099611 RepID=UPI003F8B716F
MRKIALVACSNGLEVRKKGSVEELCAYLEGLGFTLCVSPCLYEKDPVFCSVFSGTVEERAEALMSFYRDPEVQAILDLSGGDLANELLPYLDYEVIGKSRAEFWGYSDLTTILNAIYAKTGRSSVLYQARNLVSDGGFFRRPAFENTILQKQSDLFQISCQYVQKGQKQQELCGTLVGGNIRCLLKLAGTEYWPDMQDKILLLESWSGGVPKMVTYFSQLRQLSVFRQIKALLLGTFTEMEDRSCSPTIEELACHYAGAELPILKTRQIGHGKDALAVRVGEHFHFL